MRRLAGALLLLALLFTVGCSSKPSPDRVLKDFLDALVKCDFESAANLAGGDGLDKDALQGGEDEQGERLLRLILSRVSYEIGDSRLENAKAEVNVRITSPDILRITAQAISEILPMAFMMAFSEDYSQEKMDALFWQYYENALNDPGAPMLTSDVTVTLEQRDGSWVIKPDNDLLNAITGNMATAFQELEKYAENVFEEERGVATRKNPAGIGESIRVRFDDFFSGETEIIITLTDVISGSEAWEIVREANMFNHEPGEGKEYVLAAFTVEVVSVEIEPFGLNHVMFDAVSSDGVVYSDFVVVSGLNPDLATDLYVGAVHRGWTYFLVRQDDSPLAVFDRGRHGADVWFALRQ